MNLNNLKKLYLSSPLWVKQLYSAIPYDLRSGAEYRKWKEFLAHEIDEEAYQLLKLKETLTYAYENTPYYKKSFDAVDFNIHDITKLSDIEYLPYINKETVRENYEAMMAKSYPKQKTFYVTTGGSSGEPMKFLQSKNIWAKELAFVNQYFQSYGYNPSHLKASFRGGDFDNIQNHTYWKSNPISNEIHFSPFHIGQKTIQHYVNKLNQQQPRYLHSYPSALISLMKNMQENKLQLNYRPKAIFLISENISQEEILTIKAYFNCEVSSFFGHSERLIFAPFEANAYDSYKINRRYGLTELSTQNELVATSFDNFAMPLIRYKTGDYTSYQDKDKGILNLIHGRWEKDFLEGKEGLNLTLTALNMHSDIFKHVINFQFYQKKVGEVELLLIPSNNYTQEDANNILTALNKKGGHALVFSIRIISEPLLTARGKLKKLIKEIS